MHACVRIRPAPACLQRQIRVHDWLLVRCDLSEPAVHTSGAALVLAHACCEPAGRRGLSLCSARRDPGALPVRCARGRRPRRPARRALLPRLWRQPVQLGAGAAEARGGARRACVGTRHAGLWAHGAADGAGRVQAHAQRAAGAYGARCGGRTGGRRRRRGAHRPTPRAGGPQPRRHLCRRAGGLGARRRRRASASGTCDLWGWRQAERRCACSGATAQ
mmetsp:Transcript_36830/g.108606  ORF Transcript_36830/g.108606 Transcript_36830/m.108606 type:complete len:219 (+) Transcript_36830:379-1035(+)